MEKVQHTQDVFLLPNQTALADRAELQIYI